MPKWKTTIGLLALTCAALAVHGYHPYAEDAEIYLPGVEKILNPSLFPSGTEFFQSHASLTLFPHLIAASVRVTHLPFDDALFAWHLASIFLLLLAAWDLASACFPSTIARWGAVSLLAALLTLPVAGTALYIMDQYLNPRNLGAFAALFAVAGILKKRWIRSALCLIFAIACHPLMGSFALSFCILLVLIEKAPLRQFSSPAFLALLPLTNLFSPSSEAYHETARLHGYFYILRWEWYEWLGLLAPIAIFWWFIRIAESRKLQNVARLCRTLIVYDLLFFGLALLITIPKRFEALARVQPLRELHLLYMIMVLLAGGLIAEHILRSHVWRWILLFAPLCAGMFTAQRQLFPASAHIESAWTAPKNRWAQAFLWIKQNSPVNDVFAIDPMYLKIPGEDTIGFRALAQRSRLVDVYKDGGAVSMFPPLGEEWWVQLQDLKNWKKFGRPDIVGLNERYGVKWVVMQSPGIDGLVCPYQNSAVMVCRITP